MDKSEYSKYAEFKVGDIVRIRQWDDMEAEFGTYGSFGNIECTCCFVTDMKPLCGLKAKIRAMEDDSIVELEFLDEVPEEHRDRWSFSTDMIELVEDEEIIDVEPKELQPITPEVDDIGGLLAELGGLF